jgi:hypothetical protein
MAKIDVSYTAKPDPQGRRLFLDTDTGLREWEQLPDYTAPAAAGTDADTGLHEWEELPDYTAPAAASADAEIAKVAFGMSVEAEKKFEDEAKPVKHGRHKANEGDK